MDAASATPRSRWSVSQWLPKGWRDFLLQLALFTIVDVLYELTRGLSMDCCSRIARLAPRARMFPEQRSR